MNRQIEGIMQELVERAQQIREGRFSFTINADADGSVKCYVTHWFRSEECAFEDCKTVALGTPDHCLAKVADYAASYRRKPTAEEIGQTLGILPVANPQPIAAE